MLMLALVLGFLAIVLFVAVRKGWIESSALEAAANVAGIVALILALVLLFVQGTESPGPIPATAAAVTPLPTSLALRSSDLGPPDVFLSLSIQEGEAWPERNWDNGRSFYADGYHVSSEDDNVGWFSANTIDSYTDFAVEVDLTPISSEKNTGFMVAVGWKEVDDADSYYSFEGKYGGECRFTRVVDHKAYPTSSFSCPGLEQGVTMPARLEVLDHFLVAYVDNLYVGCLLMDSYDGGGVGLGALHESGSGSVAEVKYRNLAIWDPLESIPVLDEVGGLCQDFESD